MKWANANKNGVGHYVYDSSAKLGVIKQSYPTLV